MKTTIFVSKFCKEWEDDSGAKQPARFRGQITLKVPNFFERQKLKTLLMEAVTSNGETDIEAIKGSGAKINVLDLMRRMATLVQESIPFYQGVEMENVRTGV